MVATCALVLGGCSLGSTASTGASDVNVRTSAPLAVAGPQPLSVAQRIAFPLTVVRTGGIGAFDDHLVLEADGRVHVDTRTVRGRVCHLGSDQQRLLTLLAVSPLTETPSLPPAASGGGAQAAGDDEQSIPLVVTVVDERSRLITLDGSSSAEVHYLLNSLLGDVTLTTPTSTRCSQASSAPSQAHPSTEGVTSHG